MGSGRKNCLEEKDVESAVPFETVADARPQVHRKEKWNFAVPQTGVHVHRLRPSVMVSEGERGPPAIHSMSTRAPSPLLPPQLVIRR